MPLWNTSKFGIFYIFENPKLFFPFFISCYFIFPKWMPWSMSTLDIPKKSTLTEPIKPRCMNGWRIFHGITWAFQNYNSLSSYFACNKFAIVSLMKNLLSNVRHGSNDVVDNSLLHNCDGQSNVWFSFESNFWPQNPHRIKFTSKRLFIFTCIHGDRNKSIDLLAGIALQELLR